MILITLFILILFIALITLFLVKTYNKIIRVHELVKNAKGQISVQIESRWDALSNLIQGVKEYAEHEAQTLESVVKQRSPLSSNTNTNEFNQDEAEFQGALSRLIAIQESYPELKASNLYKEAMNSVDNYENQVRLARMTYNDVATRYNRTIKSIPTNIVASIMNFEVEPYLENTESKNKVPSWS